MKFIGDIDNPVTLTQALDGSLPIQAGEIIYLRGGTYRGDYVSLINGTKELPIVIKPYPGELPIIDGGFQNSGNYVTIQDIEFTYTGWANRSASVESERRSVNLSGVGNILSNCMIHDVYLVGSWQTNMDGGLRECIVYNVGAITTEAGYEGQGHGHCIYTQNEFEFQTHKNNILCMAYNYGMHAYTEGGLLNNFKLQQNICFRNGGRQFATGGLGGQRLRYSEISDNCAYEGGSFLQGSNITLTNNYFPQGYTITEISEFLTESGNFYGPKPASGVEIKIFPLELLHIGAHIAIFNWDLADAVDVDLSTVTGLNVGDNYQLRNGVDPFGDIVTGVVPADKVISVDMKAVSHSIAQRIGDAASTPATTFPEFGAFRLEKQ